MLVATQTGDWRIVKSASFYGCMQDHIKHPPGAFLSTVAADAKMEKSTCCKVLVVDDERDTADLACLLLSSHGLVSTVAYSAADALQVLECDADINVLFSDVMMPNMNGLELLRIVKARFPYVKVLLASGYISPAALQGETMPEHFIAKPYDMDEVVRLIQLQLQ